LHAFADAYFQGRNTRRHLVQRGKDRDWIFYLLRLYGGRKDKMSRDQGEKNYKPPGPAPYDRL
jgi:hypothetical protein